MVGGCCTRAQSRLCPVVAVAITHNSHLFTRISSHRGHRIILQLVVASIIVIYRSCARRSCWLVDFMSSSDPHDDQPKFFSLLNLVGSFWLGAPSRDSDGPFSVEIWHTN